MFDNLTKRLAQTLGKIINKGRLTEDNIRETTRDVRKALLEADVVLSVIKIFIQNIQKKSIGHKINNSLTPGQEFIKIVKNELILAMGTEKNDLNFSVQPPAIILIVGLQGAGKTTSLAKLSKIIKEKYKKKVLTVSTDIYRVAAIRQLEILSLQSKIDFFPSSQNQTPIEITKKAISHAKNKLYDVLLIDTAGRLHINKIMMQEIHNIQCLSKPIETLLTVDSMMGQDAVNMVKNFNDYINISGVILTKTDSDTRSGIALSMKYLVDKPIKFIGTGEKIEQLELFNPESMANRILGMNDVLSIIEKIEGKIDKSKVQQFTKKIKQGHNFDLNDFLVQVKQMKKIGSLKDLMGQFAKNCQLNNDDVLNTNSNILNKIEAMILSMTPQERMTPILIKGSRKRRISLGSGTTIQDVNKLLKNFDSVQRMMKKIKKRGIGKIIQNMKNIFPKM